MSGRSGPPAPNPKIAVWVAQRIAEAHFSQGIREGTSLPKEREMMEEYGVARTTIREALRLLEMRGLVRMRPGKNGGPVVTQPASDSLGENLTLLLQLEQASLRDVLDARLTLEPAMAKLAAERITTEQLDELERTIKEMRADSTLGDHVFADHNWCFHDTISRAAHSAALKFFLDSLRSIADGTSAGIHYSPQRHNATAAAHERIVYALRQRDPGQAEQAMREHIEEIGMFWRSRYPELLSTPIHWTLGM